MLRNALEDFKMVYNSFSFNGSAFYGILLCNLLWGNLSCLRHLSKIALCATTPVVSLIMSLLTETSLLFYLGNSAVST